MREIKFKVWDRKENRFDPSYIILSPEVMRRDDFNRFEIMQYTGLHDKNGVEIYQGDILSSGKWIAQVIYGNYGWTITPNITSQRNEVVLFNLHEILEVVGNIYDNIDDVLSKYKEEVSNE